MAVATNPAKTIQSLENSFHLPSAQKIGAVKSSMVAAPKIFSEIPQHNIEAAKATALHVQQDHASAKFKEMEASLPSPSEHQTFSKGVEKFTEKAEVVASIANKPRDLAYAGFMPSAGIGLMSWILGKGAWATQWAKPVSRGLSKAESVTGTVAEGFNAGSRYVQAHQVSDAANVVSASVGQVSNTMGQLGFTEKAGNVAEFAGKVRDFESVQAEKFGEVVAGATDKVSSFVGNVAGAKKGEQASTFLNNSKEKFTKANLGTTINKTAVGANTVVSASKDLKTISAAIEQVVELYADIKGMDARNVKITDAFFAKDGGPLVDAARKSVISAAGPGVIVTALSAVINMKMASKLDGKAGLMLLPAFMAQQSIHDAVYRPAPIMQAYSELKQNYVANGGNLDVESVAKMIQYSSPTVSDTTSHVLMETAQHYVEAGYTPGTLMKALSKGEAAFIASDKTLERYDERLGIPKNNVVSAQGLGVVEPRQMQVASG